jgi:hypothetical protein
MTYMDAAGTIRVIEIPLGNKIRVTVDRPARQGGKARLLDIMPELFEHGLTVTIDARRGGVNRT